MKNQLAGAIFFLTWTISCAAAGEFLSTVPLTENECLSSADVLKSGNIIAAGVDFTSNDILLFRVAPSGEILKAQRMSGSGQDEAQAVVATTDGGAVVVGSTNSFGAGNTDAFLMKIRKSGTVAWKRTFGTSGNEHFVKIAQTPDRGFIILGDADHDPNLNDVVIAKFNSRGRPVWTKVVSAGSFDHASGLALTSDGGAIIAIASDFAEGVRSVLAKFAADGSIQWARSYGSSGDHLALSVFQDSSGGFYFTEIFTAAGSSRSHTVLSRLDASGVPVWSRIYKARGGSLSARVIATDAGGQLLLSGNTTAAGGTNSSGVLIGVNENGKKLWRKKVKPDARPVFVGEPVIDPADGSIVIAGCVGERATNDMDSLLLKIPASGNLQGGCSKLVSFPLSSSRFNLSSAEIDLDDIAVPFNNSFAGFNSATFAAAASAVCAGE